MRRLLSGLTFVPPSDLERFSMADTDGSNSS